MPSPGGNGANPLIPLAALLVGAGVILGFALAEEPGLVVPVTLFFLLLLGLTHVLLTLETREATRRWLWGLIGAALGVRALAFLVTNFVYRADFFAPDVGYYRWAGEAIGAHWVRGGPLPGRFADGWFELYPHIGAGFYALLQDATVGPVVLNAFAGVWTAVVVYYLGREILGEPAGKLAAILTAFLPSLVLWSVLNIRDALAMLFITLAVWLGVRAYREVNVKELLLLVAVLFVASTLRDYMAVLVLGGLALGFALAFRRHRVWSTLAVGTVVFLGVAFALDQFEIFRTVDWDSPLETADQMRRGFHLEAGSAYAVDYDTSTLAGALRFLPLGMSFLLFGPFPWALESTLQMLTFPEVALWYLVFPLTVWGLSWGVRKGAAQNLILLGVLAVLVSSYALVEGNFGTAYRHRAQIMPLFFIFTAAGLILLRHRWGARKRPERQRVHTRSEGSTSPSDSTWPSGSASR